MIIYQKDTKRSSEWGRNKNENKYEENLVLHDMKHAVECHAILLLLFTWRMIELNFPPHLTFQNAQQILFSYPEIKFLIAHTDWRVGLSLKDLLMFSLMAISYTRDIAIKL